MGVTYITPVEITPGTTLSYQDVDLSSNIASGSTGVLLHVVNRASGNLNFMYRKNGSTDERTAAIQAYSHFWLACGVDENRILEIYIQTTSIDVYLVGYFDSTAVFYTNATDISLSTKNTWTDIDINVNDSAVGAFVDVVFAGWSNYALGLRKNGSTDNRITGITYRKFGFVGLDENEIFEGYIGDYGMGFFLMGYIKSGVTFNTNATDLSITATGTYTDLSALPSGANGGIIEVKDASGGLNFALRKNGSSEDIYRSARDHCWATIECDASQLIEGEIASTWIDFYLTGYTEAPASPTYGKINIRSGSNWINPTAVKYRSGSAWIEAAAIKRWNGSSWDTIS